MHDRTSVLIICGPKLPGIWIVLLLSDHTFTAAADVIRVTNERAGGRGAGERGTRQPAPAGPEGGRAAVNTIVTL
jgi:hypothetical protein